jgi:hypothetical protein
VGLQAQEAHAARTILQHCLALPDESQFLIITDETAVDTASILAETGVDLGLQPTILYYSTPMQQKIQSGPLPSNFETALADVTAALICLNSEPRNFLFRENVRRTVWNDNLRVAHMPGITKSTLLLADLDYPQLSRQCELFALALAKGSRLEIITRDRQGQTYTLTAWLDPWNRNPIISDGIIGAGVWGNVPSGETYIAPPEELAEGDIVINGSIHNFLIPPGEELVLHFHRGSLSDWSPKTNAAAGYLKSAFIDFAEERGDPNWSNLAEIGLGANPLIHQLTGNPLLDEKKLGSVHIKLGDNIDMGGTVKSDIHCNMVCLNAEVRIDQKAILAENQVVLQEADWREDLKDLRVPAHWSPNLSLRCTSVDAYIDEHGRLKRFWHTSSGRVCSVPVGSERISTQLAGVYQALQRNGRHSLTELAKQPHSLPEEELLQATYLLNLYGLVTPRDHSETHLTT